MRPFLTAAWRHLVIANFEVDRIHLGRVVPNGTELDDFEGRCLVSLVGFRFLDTRVLGIPVPAHRDFNEVNLRFYVRRRGPDGEWRRGVSFIKELVPRRAIAMIARLCYGEPYEAVPMRHRLEPTSGQEESPSAVRYEWHYGGRWHALGADVAGPPTLPPEGSEAEFTIEHYWGYTARPGGASMEYRVEHAPWRVRVATGATLDLDPGLVYGPAWAFLGQDPPTAVLVADGSPVAVFSGRPLVERA